MLASIIINLIWMFNCFLWYKTGKNKGKLIGKMEAYDKVLEMIEEEMEEELNERKIYNTIK